ncbi:hypothetical protein LPJ64_004624, partial [Coemansia asiatica]
ELSETDGETDGEPDSDSDNDTDSNIDSDTESDSGSDTDSEAHTHILTDNDFKLLNILKSMTKRTDSSTRLEYCAEVDNSDISDILINRKILKISDTKDFSKYKNRLKWIAEKNKANE